VSRSGAEALEALAVRLETAPGTGHPDVMYRYEAAAMVRAVGRDLSRHAGRLQTSDFRPERKTEDKP
jgi:hypothetical protein